MSTRIEKDTIRQGYTEIAESSGGCSCCGDDAKSEDIAGKVGYDAAELANLPAGANLGLSCGNPSAVAELKEGETVVDLGSGAGFDAFICAAKVGATGEVIGVDMTPAMIGKADKNKAAFAERTGLNNVQFRLGEIEYLPIADNEADVVISNCVINLSPDKQQVWNEIQRVLKPGGRVSVSDIALLKELPGEAAASVAATVGCVGGAVPVEETVAMAERAGLVDVKYERKDEYVDAMEEWKDPLYRDIKADLPEGHRMGDYIASVIFTARKGE
jgi:SAM-dependent methyltransferase